MLVLFVLIPVAASAETATAIFAAGCFWCAEDAFEKVPGVTNVISGYTGGTVKNPSYEQVSAGGTGHYESIKVYYDTTKTTYAKLLDVFWKNEDPVDADGQFCDKGQQYRAVIFYANPEQKKLAEVSKQALIKSGKFTTIATEILPAQEFYPAEDYHQNYATKNPVRYHYYRYRCGRDQRLQEVWGEK
jgi:peptide-methionine (S)-S-oxide reductase